MSAAEADAGVPAVEPEPSPYADMMADFAAMHEDLSRARTAVDQFAARRATTRAVIEAEPEIEAGS